MNIALWVMASFLALAFLAAGLMKVSQPREKLVASGMKWAAAGGRFGPYHLVHR